MGLSVSVDYSVIEAFCLRDISESSKPRGVIGLFTLHPSYRSEAGEASAIEVVQQICGLLLPPRTRIEPGKPGEQGEAGYWIGIEHRLLRTVGYVPNLVFIRNRSWDEQRIKTLYQLIEVLASYYGWRKVNKL